ncbi:MULTISPECIES: hypothetical protein [Pseudomonas]|uniref:Uncharacterized protein n=3 Tax=Pseudomonas syringae group TaxID=136849 RepID=A0A3M4P7H7_PSEVI|nr:MULTISPECIES: hypothetical protein [Pseudomonas]MDU8544941.1 hypothetical protein [Pseudomonas syringae group sp. J248-6]RMP02634.1 hypothetical protein ALQ30_04872 [Pseudomonas syringae pv. persicae]RMP81685.1 hypothetical protein ALQ15_103514 [Pseudomonas syringae pv. actinidiae]RMQ12679.1 hypothetical protein ALQ09_05411 [Pseudomonas viridiflava]RMQ74126.1 hypothetical protein ALP98_100840 [Pseudomonas viridiflava]
MTSNPASFPRAVMHAAAQPHYNTVKSAYGVKSDGCLIETTVLRCALSRLCGALQPWAAPGFWRFFDPFQGARAQGRGFAPQKLRRASDLRAANSGGYIKSLKPKKNHKHLLPGARPI